MGKDIRRSHLVPFPPWDRRARLFRIASSQPPLESLGRELLFARLPFLVRIGASTRPYEPRFRNRKIAQFHLIDSDEVTEKGILKTRGTLCHQIVEAADILWLRRLDDLRELHSFLPTCPEKYFKNIENFYALLSDNQIPTLALDESQPSFNEQLRWGTTKEELLKMVQDIEEFIIVRLSRHQKWRGSYDKGEPGNFYPRNIEPELVIENLPKMAELTIKPDEVWFEGSFCEDPVILSIKSGTRYLPKSDGAWKLEMGLLAAGGLLLKREALNSIRIGKYLRKVLPPVWAFPSYPLQQFRVEYETAYDYLSKLPPYKKVKIICVYLGEEGVDKGLLIHEVGLKHAIKALNRIWSYV